MAEKLNEQDCRRLDFIGGIPVKMIDNQDWYFAEPRMRLVPSDSDNGFEAMLSLDDGGEFDRLITEYGELTFLPPNEFEQFANHYASLEVKLCRMMLERNYTLTLDQLKSILQISHDKNDEVASDIRTRVLGVAIGASPKNFPGGGGGSPMPKD